MERNMQRDIDFEVIEAATGLIKLCLDEKVTIATAESCTGGLVATTLTDVAGSSAVFDRAYVTYSNEAKQQMLGVTATTLKQHGAVSRQTAEAMAEGALSGNKVGLAVAITGIAGPGGGTADKPVGLVHFAVASRNGTTMHVVKRFGDISRAEIRRMAMLQALRMLREVTLAEAAKRTRWKPPAPPVPPEPWKPPVLKEWPDRERKIS
jgi:nicotinamide-nucleotide amidase